MRRIKLIIAVVSQIAADLFFLSNERRSISIFNAVHFLKICIDIGLLSIWAMIKLIVLIIIERSIRR
jgi:hypothetical protein